MAGGNYLRCAVCSCKTVYSGDLNWPDGVTIITYCAEHDPDAAEAAAPPVVDRDVIIREIDKWITAAPWTRNQAGNWPHIFERADRLISGGTMYAVYLLDKDNNEIATHEGTGRNRSEKIRRTAGEMMLEQHEDAVLALVEDYDSPQWLFIRREPPTAGDSGNDGSENR